MMPVTKKVQWTSLRRRVSRIEGKGAMLAPASKVSAIHRRPGSPWLISVAVGAGGMAGGRVAVGPGVLVTVAVDVGDGATVEVGGAVGLGVLVKVAVGRGVGVAVGGAS